MAEGFRPMARAVERIYSSSHKDWSCWTGLNTLSKADALCDTAPRAPRLRVHRTGSRGVTVLLVKGRSYAQPDPRAFADAILRRE